MHRARPRGGELQRRGGAKEKRAGRNGGSARRMTAWRHLAEREGFEPSSPLTEANGFRDRPVQPLRHLSAGGFTGLTRLPQLCCAVWCAGLSLNSLGLGLHVRLTETTVPLGRHDRRVAEDFLQGCKASARLQPPARE